MFLTVLKYDQTDDIRSRVNPHPLAEAFEGLGIY